LKEISKIRFISLELREKVLKRREFYLFFCDIQNAAEASANRIASIGWDRSVSGIRLPTYAQLCA